MTFRTEFNEMTSSRPIHECRIGRIVAAIWENKTTKGVRHGIKISRLYKSEKDGTWQRTDTYDRDDLPVVEKVADMAFCWIHEEAGRGSRESE